MATPQRAARYPFIPTPGTPLTIVGGEGSYLFTDTGRRILDAGGGAIVTNIGHGRPEIAAAAAEALRGSGYVVPLWATEARLALIERLTRDWLPEGLNRVLLCSGGSESVDTAMRVARQYHMAKGRPERWKVVGRSISYHGATLASLSVANHDRRKAPFGPLLLDLPKIDPCDADQAIKLIEAEDPATVSAVILEPVVGASGGGIVSPADYWPRIREFCTAHDILLIADEVMTGYGRTGRAMGVDHWGVVPDVLVGGKGLAGGYAAMGAVAATDAVVEPIAAAGDSVMFFTFSGSDVGCAIASAVLQILEEEALVARAATAGATFRALLEDRLADHPQVAEVRGLGLMQGVELVRDRATGAHFGGALAPAVVAEAMARDCWIYPAGSAGVPDALLFGPPFTMSDDELETVADITRAAIDAAVATTA